MFPMKKMQKGYDLLDKKYKTGAWIEYAGEFLAGAPTLGVRMLEERNEVGIAIPGMIMTIDKDSFEDKPAYHDTAFFRLFAPAAPHTTSAIGRDCKSCHNNPLAIGYGRGILQFNQSWEKSIWKFTPEYADITYDGLPADAWIGFLEEPEPGKDVSTRDNFRPFTLEEQQKILTVGACLTCHDRNSMVMKETLHTDFTDYLLKISPKCILPEF